MASIDRQSSCSTSAVPAFIKRRNHNYYFNQSHRSTICHSNNNNHNNDENENDDSDCSLNNGEANGSTKNGNGAPSKLQQDVDDSYSVYRRLCEVRMRRLERYKKARSFCSLHDENSSDTPVEERVDDIFARSQRQPASSNRRDYEGGKMPALGEASRATSSSCSHLYTGLDRRVSDGARDSFHLYGGSHDENTSLNFAVWKDHGDRELAALKPATNSDSICVDSECSTGAGHVPLTHYINVPTDHGITGYDIDKNNNTNNSWSTPNSALNVVAVGANPSPLNIQFEILREKMIAIMENDVQLLKKLLTLGETIQEIRETRVGTGARLAPPIQPHVLHSNDNDSGSSSDQNTEEEEEMDEWRPLNNSATQSTVTRLFVGGERGASDDEDSVQPSVQYFSRRNSVLRIPIPPRSSNRMLGKRSVVKLSEFTRNSTKPSNGTQSREDSGHSSASNSPAGQCSPNGLPAAAATEVPPAMLNTTLPTQPPLEMAIFALRSELKASLMHGGAKADAADSGRSTLIQCSSSSALSSVGGSSSRYSTFSAESLCMESLSGGSANSKTIFVGIDENFGGLSPDAFEMARTIS